MQAWLSNELQSCDGLADLILNIDYIEDFQPTKTEESRIIKSFKSCVSALYINEVISENKNISLTKPDSLKPDFLLYSAESEGMVIIELKNFSGPTRDAGTELGAYACELRSYLPFLADGDLFKVIISPVWPVLLKHFIFHEIFWQQKNLICLQPVQTNTGVKLEIIDVTNLLAGDITLKISDQHITGYQLCLYDYGLYTKDADRERLNKHVPQMKAALSVMASEGNRLNGHGFAFLWKDDWDLSLAPYSISIFNMAPFQSIERFLHEVDSLDNLNEMQLKFIKLLQEQDPSGHGDSLNNITKAGRKFLSGFCNPLTEGFSNWAALQEIMLERAELLAFQGWGLFGNLFNERLIKAYSAGHINSSITCPELGLEVVNSLIDPNYEFINMQYFDAVDEVDDVE